MRLEELRQADLNLLITFAAIAEEKSITAAAARQFLSQPAVSRALQRARAMFQDKLLVRSPRGFELTLRGRRVLQELEGLLPRMENLASHSVVSTYAGVQTIPDKQLAAVGAKRNSCIRVPYFGVALQCLPRTELVLTLTSGMSSAVRGNRQLRVVKAPHELHSFHFLMAWHPRVNSDPRHVWLREAMRSTTAALNE
jgi:DNA-binding transcriptional LysR family regulator